MERKCRVGWTLNIPTDVYFCAGVRRNGTRNSAQKMLLILLQSLAEKNPNIATIIMTNS